MEMKPGSTTLFKGDERPDFVVFVWFTTPSAPDDCRIFVVPTKDVDADVLESQRHWHSYPRRDGSPTTKSGHVMISWTGNNTLRNIGRGFATKWAKYENAWHLLAGDATAVSVSA
jgi:hypothetical protein